MFDAMHKNEHDGNIVTPTAYRLPPTAYRLPAPMAYCLSPTTVRLSRHRLSSFADRPQR